MNSYRHTFYARCPVDDSLISYSLVLQSDVPVMAEDIVAACSFGTAYHEDIADRLHAILGGEQTIVARHGSVEIETTRP